MRSHVARTETDDDGTVYRKRYTKAREWHTIERIGEAERRINAEKAHAKMNEISKRHLRERNAYAKRHASRDQK